MIQAYRTTPVAIEAGGLLPFTGSRRCGCAAILESGSVRLRSAGIYQVMANFSFAATAAGPVTVTLQVNGEDVETNIATETAATAGDVVNVTIPSMIRVDGSRCECGEPVSVGYIVNAAGTLQAASAVVVKVK